MRPGTRSSWIRSLHRPRGMALILAVLVAGGAFWLAKPRPSSIRPDASWTNTLGMRFVRIPAGSFARGDDRPGADPLDRPRHLVTFTQSFWLASTEVTRTQWKALMESRPSKFQGDNLPVEQVSWDDAQTFLRRLNEREGTSRYRLPTEAEWEYACRAGVHDPEMDPEPCAWFDPGSVGQSHPVTLKRPNAWGLYDMLGNVYEWCQDARGPYPGGSPDPAAGTARAARGGSWEVHANRTKPGFRDFFPQNHRFRDLGFRVAADRESR